ncbi:MAG: hypothetical protein GKR89_23000 [Candidatus Latescibacteria bacterium]|nr:hypothetical protein [Candidatus Latescibacterota bacterium]
MAELTNGLIQGERGARALGVLVMALGCFFAISQLSYAPGDFPNSSRTAEDCLNWGGRVGAYIAYGGFISMGYPAWVLPLLCLVWGWNRLKRQSLEVALYRSVGLFGIALLLSIAAGLPNYSAYAVFEWGGWLGTRVSSVILIPYIGRLGSAILLGALLIMAVVLTSDIDPRPVWQGMIRLWNILLGGVKNLGRLPLWFKRMGRSSKKIPTKAPQKLDEGKKPSEPALQRPVVENGNTEETTTVIDPLPDVPPLIVASQEDSGPLSPETAPVRKPVPAAPEKTAPVASSQDVYQVPDIDLLDEVPIGEREVDKDRLLKNAQILEDAFQNFDVGSKVVEVSPGPVVTRYEVEPAAGVKVNRIVNLADDLARVMSAKGIRIQAPVPGKSVVGVEIANDNHEVVYLREILQDKVFRKADSKLTMALGKTIAGDPFVADLSKMPHLLVAGATGSGKSVCINALITSVLFKSTPDEVRFIMVDPKVVELNMYNDIPHLLAPVITEPKKASEALKWATAEMEVRYRKLAQLGVRNLADYNRKVERWAQEADEGEEEVEPPIPYIVIVIDEFADLMLTAPADVETSLMSLAQKSRAVGIHLILATQRPSVNVITGVIKANFPSRIAFQVASKTDSRTILDINGAERLLGRGDMLFLPGGQGEPIRVHGAFISGEETERLVEEIRGMGYQTDQVAIFSDDTDIKTVASDQDELFNEALALVIESQQASTSYLQRRMKVGYARAARLMDELERAGVVGPAEGAKPRQILHTGNPVESDSPV